MGKNKSRGKPDLALVDHAWMAKTKGRCYGEAIAIL
jgi:hypothetical protein